MIIEFIVKNFRSIRNEARFSMVKAAGNELLATNVLQFPDAPAKLSPLLRSAAVYGANAAGKSNLLRALACMRELVVGSSQRNPGQALPVEPYMLSEETRQAATKFEIHFIVNQVRYQYGISASQQQVQEEWLYAFPKGRAQKWFVRTLKAERYQVEFGDNLKGEKDLWERITRPNGTLLATAAQLNSEQLTPIFQWFATQMKVAVGRHGWNQSPGVTIHLSSSQHKQKLLDFLRAADFAISDFGFQEVDAKELEDMAPSLPPQLRAMLQGTDTKGVRIHTRHETQDGGTIKMDFDQESDGTQRMFCYAGHWLDALANGCVMIIDELHDSLHPLLVEYLISMFHDPALNTKGAQLIFSTHETAILNQELFRRDQIWFCERDNTQSTLLYPLSDFAVRKRTDNIEKHYLSGRYGALPFIRSLSAQFAETSDGA